MLHPPGASGLFLSLGRAFHLLHTDTEQRIPKRASLSPLQPHPYPAPPPHTHTLHSAPPLPPHSAPQFSSWFFGLARNILASLRQPAGVVCKTPKGPAQHFLGALAVSWPMLCTHRIGAVSLIQRACSIFQASLLQALLRSASILLHREGNRKQSSRSHAGSRDATLASSWLLIPVRLVL